MSLSVGIVGLPNVGKSTLFNALLKKQQAYAANFPFATIDPNVGIVPVPDSRLESLAETIKFSLHLNELPPEVPATVEFLDIAGLIAGAHKGEGLGNKFLSHIREVDAICHVVRAFNEADIVKEGSVDPEVDLSVIETELMMADLETLERQREPKGNASREEKLMWEAVVLLTEAINKGVAARFVPLTNDQKKEAKSLSLLSMKPILVVLNISEDDLVRREADEKQFAQKASLSNDQVIAISAKMESQLAGLSDKEQKEYLQEIGVNSTGLERLVKKAFTILVLITFLTAGEKEVRAWTIKKGMTAQQAAGVIHTDFEKNFIKVEVVAFEDFVELSGWKNAREKGRVRQEGRDYIMQDGDVVEFKVGV